MAPIIVTIIVICVIIATVNIVKMRKNTEKEKNKNTEQDKNNNTENNRNNQQQTGTFEQKAKNNEERSDSHYN